MTFEERIEKLTERHEALAQSVELMRIHGEEQDRRIDRLFEKGEKIDRQIEVLVAEGRETRKQILALNINVEALLSVAQMHERRISGLEAA